ncbi:MAG: hypothetical protein R8K20_06560, partial [Gallionellaceae bacterium]
PIKSLQKELYISKDLTLIASSPSLSKRQQDWGENIQICGDLNSFSIDQPSTLPQALKSFLDAGKPPVYMTFGSLSPYERENTVSLMLDAAEKSGCRAIIQTDWDLVSSKANKADVFACGTLPHAEIFPHCAAIVHHGGAGTTHSALRAGTPSIVVEHAFDQCFWGKELNRVGVAGELLHRNNVTASQLAQAIKTTTSSEPMKHAASDMREKMLKEDGVKSAVKLIEDFAGRRDGSQRLA